MLGFGQSGPVAEDQARGEVEQVYHEIKQVLRVSGVNLVFRTWAQYEPFFLQMWQAMRPNCETLAFEQAADQLRARAVSAADRWDRLGADRDVPLGESQRYHIQHSLRLYHYINPKLLILVSAVRRALQEEAIDSEPPAVTPPRLQRGIPAGMLPMEMEAEQPHDKRLKAVFQDIQQTLALPSVNSDYRTLALWPDYLQAAWAKLKPVVQQPQHTQQTDQLRAEARELASHLPYRVKLSRDRLEQKGEKIDKVLETTDRFEQLLPGLILNVALLSLDWHPPDELAESPFPSVTAPSGQ